MHELLFVYGTLRPPTGASNPVLSFNYPKIMPYLHRQWPARLPGAELYDLGSFPAAVPGTGELTGVLLEIDPAGRVDYLQSLLLNQIEKGADPNRQSRDETAQLREWLGRLREVDSSAVTTEFEAGVLDLAGFRDQAIDAYRRALALHPERADDYLLLADLLRQANRQPEAVASLQYITEHAESDELFLIAVDGITNMRTGSVATLKWAERRALERLTTRDDKLYLYEMLSDLAEEARDPKVYLAAVENSLAHADSRRSHVLRELLAATAEATTYEASQGANRPDAALNVAYARRLIDEFAETDAILPPLVFALLSLYLDHGPFAFDASALAERLTSVNPAVRVNAERLAALQPELERFFDQWQSSSAAVAAG